MATVAFPDAVQASTYYVLANMLLDDLGRQSRDYLGGLASGGGDWWVELKQPLPEELHQAIVEAMQGNMARMEAIRRKLAGENLGAASSPPAPPPLPGEPVQ